MPLDPGQQSFDVGRTAAHERALVTVQQAQLTEQPNSGKNTGFMGFILQLESKSR